MPPSLNLLYQIKNACLYVCIPNYAVSLTCSPQFDPSPLHHSFLLGRARYIAQPKVFERIIYDQVYGYLTENNLISSQQSGFRSLHSTVTALLEATITIGPSTLIKAV